LGFYEQRSDFVVPETRYHEIKEFVRRGLQDFSISRLKSKMPWGVPVPGDEEHVMYVWFDALVNYISTLGWPNKSEKFDAFWPGVQIAGKDNLRQQAAMWQAMLMSAGVQNSEQILIHGFITSNGQKMSKSLGNVVGPYEIIEKYGVDALRYWLLREANMFEDSDFTWEKFKESYNANLANGLGNLMSRVMKMAVVNNVRVDIGDEKMKLDGDVDATEFHQLMSDFDVKGAINLVWRRVRGGDAFVQEKEPFKKIKTNPEEAKNDIAELLRLLSFVGYRLEPFMPETSEKILEAIKHNSEITTPLFPRIQ
jgi:methionyl-tRNA synthetase